MLVYTRSYDSLPIYQDNDTDTAVDTDTDTDADTNTDTNTIIPRQKNKRVTFDVCREVIYVLDLRYSQYRNQLWWSQPELDIITTNFRRELTDILISYPHIDIYLARKLLLDFE